MPKKYFWENVKRAWFLKVINGKKNDLHLEYFRDL